MLRLLKTVVFGLSLGLFGSIVNVTTDVRKLEENVGLGLLFYLRGAVKPPSDAVIVAMDRESSEELKLSNNPERWPRSLHAQLVEKLSRAGARVIVLDLYFVEPRSLEEDNELAAAIGKAGNVVLAERLDPKEVFVSGEGEERQTHVVVKTEKPIESISQTAFGTAPFVLPRKPVRVSQFWTFQPSAGDAPTFPMLALHLYALDAYSPFFRLIQRTRGQGAITLPSDAKLRTTSAAKFMRDLKQQVSNDSALTESFRSIAQRTQNRRLSALANIYAGDNRRYLNFYGPPRTVFTVPYYQALKLGSDEGKSTALDVKDKAVFIGLSEIQIVNSKDSFNTIFSDDRGIDISGVEIAATAFLNMLTNSSVLMAPAGHQIVTLMVWGMLVALISRALAPIWTGVSIILCSALYLFAAWYQFRASTTWYPVVVPLLFQAPLGYVGALLWDYFEVNKQRKVITQALGYYVPEEVVSQVARDMIDIRKYGQTVYGACLFADVAGYTPVSEKLSPRELSDLMHKYLEAAFEQIHKHNGLVVELKGDSILALWKGSPNDTGFRRQACVSVLDMAKAVEQFNQSNPIVKLPTRLSIHAGPIFLGNMGAGAHYEFGVTGDTVTTASRLDGLNKYLGTKILVSAEVIDGLPGLFYRKVGTFRLKGKTKPIVAYELICREDDCHAWQKDACALFAEARESFKARLWDEAENKFMESDRSFNGDDLSRFYVKLCAQYRSHPPPMEWNETIVMDDK